MRTDLHTCPGCNEGIPFGLRRCYHCGIWLCWEGERQNIHPYQQKTEPRWPQKAQFVMSAFARAEPDETSNPVSEYPKDGRVVVIGFVGEYFALEYGGYVHYSRLAIFGSLNVAKIINPTNSDITEVKVLDTPKWGASPEDCGKVLSLISVGETVEIWETMPGWVRIGRGTTHWVSSFWFDQEMMRRISQGRVKAGDGLGEIA